MVFGYLVSPTLVLGYFYLFVVLYFVVRLWDDLV